MTTDKKPESEDSPLTRLNKGLLLLNLKKEIDEAAYSVIDRVTFGHQVVKNRHTYSSELIRVLDELQLIAYLISEIDEAKQFKHKTHEPEELINYYSGIFFGLVHQIKDKLMRLIDFMAAVESQKRPYQEPEKVSPARLSSKHGELIDKIGIRDEVMEWAEDSPSIGVVLKKRTKHHHFASRLQLDSDFQNIKMSKLMLAPPTTAPLTDYGKQYMEKLGKESYQKLKVETMSKQEQSINIIVNNLNTIAEKLIKHFDIPTTPEETAKISADYMEFLGSLKIKNEASLDKITADAKQMTDELVETAKKMGDKVIAAYIVGSSVRGEFIPGSSDINMYVITKDYTEIYDSEQPATLYILSEKDFLSEEHKKARFICWSDGVLVLGAPYNSKKEFPKPGTKLCMLLNRGVIERLEEYKAKIEALENPSTTELRLYGLKVAKIMLDYAFGVAMSNKPFYSASRKKKIEHIKSAFSNAPITLTLEQIYYGALIKQKDIITLIDTFIANNRNNYEKQEAVLKEAV
jgi:predicted nucleotidyltransferase